jgi:tRNA threonylcarbamoyl adenosine modification protein YeaZ
MSWLLALHSSSEVLGVAVQPLGDGEPAKERRTAGFPLGRSLSNQLLDCVEQLLPASEWHRLGRLVVATGPGGFTGTRLTVVLARTLAQQLAIPLHGVSSFELVAARHGITTPTWIVQELPRRGLVAALYGQDQGGLSGLVELRSPRLFAPGVALPDGPQLPAAVRFPDDLDTLLAIGARAAERRLPAAWPEVLPIYPTSPVQEI